MIEKQWSDIGMEAWAIGEYEVSYKEFIYCLLELDMPCDYVTRGYGDHSHTSSLGFRV